jgi:hypothetical protein
VRCSVAGRRGGDIGKGAGAALDERAKLAVGETGEAGCGSNVGKMAGADCLVARRRGGDL